MSFAEAPTALRLSPKNATPADTLIYFDSTYLVRLYFEDNGFETVRRLAATDTVACAQHGRAEVISALHRKLRERTLTPALYQIAVQQFLHDNRSGAFTWLPLGEQIFERVAAVYVSLPVRIFLRAADALHLAVAAHNHLQRVYSNDAKLLAAAEHFGIQGEDVVP